MKSGSFEASYWRSKKFDLSVFLKEVSHMDDFNLKEVIHVKASHKTVTVK